MAEQTQQTQATPDPRLVARRRLAVHGLKTLGLLAITAIFAGFAEDAIVTHQGVYAQAMVVLTIAFFLLALVAITQPLRHPSK